MVGHVFEKIERRNRANGSRVADVASCNCGNETRFNRKINWHRSRPFPRSDIIKFFLLEAAISLSLSLPFFYLFSLVTAGRPFALAVYRPRHRNRNQWQINWRNITIERVDVHSIFSSFIDDFTVCVESNFCKSVIVLNYSQIPFWNDSLYQKYCYNLVVSCQRLIRCYLCYEHP